MTVPAPVAAGIRSANEEIRDRLILHAVFLQRMKTGEVRRLVKFLNDDVFPDLTEIYLGRLARIEAKDGLDAGTWTTRRYRDMMAQADLVIKEGMAEVQERTGDLLFKQAQHEARFLVGTIQSAVPINLDLRLPNLQLLRSVVVSRPFQGKLLKEWYGDQTEALQKKVRQQFRIGLAEGESIPQLVRRLRGKGGLYDQTRHGVEAITRTAVNHVTTHSRLETGKRNESVIQAGRWLSTLDTKTTPICQARDGMKIDLQKGPFPPAHIGCRSDLSFELKSWEELGIDLDEAPPGTRESLNGAVPETQTYPEWLRKNLDREWMDPKTKKTKTIGEWVLGKKKKELFRRGNLRLDQFVDDHGKALTFDELEALEAKVLKKAGKLAPPPKPKPRLLRGHEVRSKVKTNLARIDDEIKALEAQSESQWQEIGRMEKERFEAIRKGADPATLPSTASLGEGLDRTVQKVTQLRRNRSTVVQDILRVDDPMKVVLDVNVKGRGSSRIRSEAARGSEFLQSILSRTVFGRSQVNFRFQRLPARERAYHWQGTVHLSSTHAAQTYVHELGHALEWKFPKMGEAARDFLKTRSKLDDPKWPGLQKLSAITGNKRYKARERAWKDRFIHPYMGKFYETGSTEISSMALEYLVADPLRLMEKDPEMFDFIVDLIRGFHF